jgi:hypothetical protein
MVLKVIDEGKRRDIEIGEGEMFLLPGEYNKMKQRIDITPNSYSIVRLSLIKLIHHTIHVDSPIQSALYWNKYDLKVQLVRVIVVEMTLIPTTKTPW